MKKPGLQAIANTAPDLPPVPGKHARLGRDHEYQRLGTCSILAGLDLHDGHVTAPVWSAGIAAASLLHGGRIWTSIIQPDARFG